jgi:hypothetical protein
VFLTLDVVFASSIFIYRTIVKRDQLVPAKWIGDVPAKDQSEVGWFRQTCPRARLIEDECKGWLSGSPTFPVWEKQEIRGSDASKSRLLWARVHKRKFFLGLWLEKMSAEVTSDMACAQPPKAKQTT